MSKKRKIVSLAVFGVIIAALLAGIVLTAPHAGVKEPINEVMKDAVLHETGRIDIFGKIQVNPALVSAWIVTGILIVFAVITRIFFIPKFTQIPGKFQYLLEKGVGLFTGLAKQNSPQKTQFIGGYIFTAGVYIFIGTIFELFGFQAVTVSGLSVSLPAPLADINGAIAMGFFSYGVILFGGLVNNGIKGMLHALKDFTLPVSMSFRLFGALLSGALVTELVYYYALTSYVVPVIVGVLFTLLHALIQAYVLTMLVSIFYGESSEKKEKPVRPEKIKKEKRRKTV